MWFITRCWHWIRPSLAVLLLLLSPTITDPRDSLFTSSAVFPSVAKISNYATLPTTPAHLSLSPLRRGDTQDDFPFLCEIVHFIKIDPFFFCLLIPFDSEVPFAWKNYWRVVHFHFIHLLLWFISLFRKTDRATVSILDFRRLPGKFRLFCCACSIIIQVYWRLSPFSPTN